MRLRSDISLVFFISLIFCQFQHASADAQVFQFREGSGIYIYLNPQTVLQERIYTLSFKEHSTIEKNSIHYDNMYTIFFDNKGYADSILYENKKNINKNKSSITAEMRRFSDLLIDSTRSDQDLYNGKNIFDSLHRKTSEYRVIRGNLSSVVLTIYRRYEYDIFSRLTLVESRITEGSLDTSRIDRREYVKLIYNGKKLYSVIEWSEKFSVGEDLENNDNIAMYRYDNDILDQILIFDGKTNNMKRKISIVKNKGLKK